MTDNEAPISPRPSPGDPVRAALAWYGEQARLARLIHREGDSGRHALADDGGKRATAALAHPQQGGERDGAFEQAARIADARAEFLLGSDGIRVHEARTIAASIRDLITAPTSPSKSSGEEA